MIDSEPLAGRIDAVLSAFLDERIAGLADLGPDVVPVLDSARRFVLDGGKRIRPVYAYWGWRAAAEPGADDTHVLRAAASLELVHACALVHDDVMDDSDTRRGHPTTHTAFAALHRQQNWYGAAGGFGAAAAILQGDVLLVWADALFASAQVPAPSRDAYDRMREQVMAGQYLDVLVQARGEFSADDALRVARFKTSKYTVVGPLRLGAAAAGADPVTIAALERYGDAIGEAFQLRDDLLGTFGDPSRTGKPAGDDIREGKRTLLVAYAMQRADPVQAAALRACLGDRHLDAAGVERACEILEATGAVARVEARIDADLTAALAALVGSPVDPAAVDALGDLAAAAARRHA